MVRIALNDVHNLLYNCNVNFYDWYVDTDEGCIIIDVNELEDNIDLDELIKGFERIVTEDIEYNDGSFILYFDEC